MSIYEARLFALRDEDYLRFNAGLIPTVDRTKMIGVRNPDVKRLAKEIAAEGNFLPFLNDLPHTYYEENNLHAELIHFVGKDYDTVLPYVEAFLPYIDNWATCDCFKVNCFAGNKNRLIREIEKWLKSDRVYTVRFALVNLMRYYLDEDFTPMVLELAAKMSDEYYINMAEAWLFSVALVKQYDTAIHYFYDRRLSVFVHNKALQKARESLRIGKERKEEFAGLKI